MEVWRLRWHVCLCAGGDLRCCSRLCMHSKRSRQTDGLRVRVTVTRRRITPRAGAATNGTEPLDWGIDVVCPVTCVVVRGDAPH